MNTGEWRSSQSAIGEVLAGQAADQQFHYPIRHGSMRVGLYAPRGVDRQSPHEQDEIYIVASGSGWFERDGACEPFAAGDVLFVPAGMLHRFVDFSADFATWVVFWGPPGGE